MPRPSISGESPSCPPDEAAGSGIPGLDPGRLHEVHAAGEDRAAALTFALVQAGVGGRPLFLVRPRGGGRRRAGLHGEGLAWLGLDAARLTLVEAADETALLRAALDAARCPALAAVVIESAGRLAAYDLTASRRLALAAERSGSRVVLVRIAAEPRPSAAFTRWTIASAPSAPLAGAAPGRPVLAARLDRRRGWAGRQAHWLLEWVPERDSSHGFFRPLPPASPETASPETASPWPAAPVPGAVAALAGLRGGAGSRAA